VELVAVRDRDTKHFGGQETTETHALTLPFPVVDESVGVFVVLFGVKKQKESKQMSEKESK
jgi:6-phosphogluconolactonase/glucosamine-6-phosphate isomerase/deaminase